MSPALAKMWTTISGMVIMFISMVFIYLSRFKIQNRVLKFILAFIAYVFLAVSALILFVVVFGGPSSD